MRRSLPSWIKRALLLHLALLLTVIASTYVPPRVFWPAMFLAASFPVFALSNLALLAFTWQKRSRYLVFPLAGFLASLPLLLSTVSWHCFGQKAKANFRLSSWNAGAYYHYLEDRKGQAPDPTPLLEYLEQADVLCLQELIVADQTMNRLAKAFPYGIRTEGGNTAICSRFPIRQKGKAVFPGSGNSFCWADLEVRGSTLRVYSIHLQSNRISREAGEILRENKLDVKRDTRGLLSLLRRVKRNTLRRAEQSDKVLQHILACPYPVVLAGDFNETPHSYLYRRFHRLLPDAFCKAGCGLDVTYNGRIPFLRIDHIFASPELTVSEHTTRKTRISDHNPVTVDLVFP